jgi:hypothetical protein
VSEEKKPFKPFVAVAVVVTVRKSPEET